MEENNKVPNAAELHTAMGAQVGRGAGAEPNLFFNATDFKIVSEYIV